MDEISRHLLPRQLAEVHALLRSLDVEIDERFMVPFECVERYIARGLKRGDAFVSGYAQWAGADCLVSENRKDLVDHPELFPKLSEAYHDLLQARDHLSVAGVTVLYSSPMGIASGAGVMTTWKFVLDPPSQAGYSVKNIIWE